MVPLRSSVGDIPFLFEDADLVVMVKPAGLPTANAPHGAESLHALLRARFGANAFLGVVSRLDAAVSGLVVLARSPSGAAGLAEQFRERTVEKGYMAVITGRFPAPLGEWVDWHDAIARRDGDLKSVIHPVAAARPGGGDEAPKPAHVHARVVKRSGEVSLVELEPSTGRRHQLRLQLASRGCPIVGDRLYGSRLPCRAGGIALRATRLVFVHPATERTMRFEAACHDSWAAVFPSLFSDERRGPPAGGNSSPSRRGW